MEVNDNQKRLQDKKENEQITDKESLCFTKKVDCYKEICGKSKLYQKVK